MRQVWLVRRGVAVIVGVTLATGVGACGALPWHLGHRGASASPAPGVPGGRPGDGSDPTPSRVTAYAIVGGHDLSPTPTTRDAALWATFRAVASDAVIAAKVASFQVSEEKSDRLAQVSRSEADPSRWDVDINATATTDQRDLVVTLVHEYGHIVTLSPPEVTAQTPCPGVTIDEGCAVPQSLLSTVMTRWWAGYGDGAASAPDRDADTADALAAAHPGAFVSGYAATSPVEDLAETWAWFVLTDKPAGAGEAQDKIRLLWERPDLVAERGRIRADLAAAGLPQPDPATTQ